jgi:hypothetical protein
MVRPKASLGNLRVALAFAELMIVRSRLGEENPKKMRILRKGPRSPYAAFRACFPDLVRYTRDKYPTDRLAVSILEFDKALKRAGFKSYRRRERTDNAIQWRFKVCIPKSEKPRMYYVIPNLLNPILQHWDECRWRDPNDPEDISEMASLLEKFQSDPSLEPLSQCTMPRLQELLHNIRDETFDGYSDGEASGQTIAMRGRKERRRSKQAPIAISKSPGAQPTPHADSLDLPPPLCWSDDGSEVCGWVCGCVGWVTRGKVHEIARRGGPKRVETVTTCSCSALGQAAQR